MHVKASEGQVGTHHSTVEPLNAAVQVDIYSMVGNLDGLPVAQAGLWLSLTVSDRRLVDASALI